MAHRTSRVCLAVIASGALAFLVGCGSSQEGATSTVTPTSQAQSTSAAAGPSGTESPAASTVGDAPSEGGAAPTTASSAPPAPSDGGAVPVPTSTPPEGGAIWDPCGFADSDISAAGLDPASESKVTDSTYPTWRMCEWQAADGSYEVVATSSDQTLDGLLRPGAFHDVRETQYYGRDVRVYRSVQDTNKLGCMSAAATSYGSVVLTVRNTQPNLTGEQEPCAVVQRVSAQLFRTLPS